MAEKFVDPEGGSDSNSGDSDAAPLKTPPSATDDLVIRLKRGTRYVRTSQWNWGTAARMTLKDYGDASAPNPRVTIAANSTNLINVQGDGTQTFRNIDFEDCVSNSSGCVIGAGLVAATSRCAVIDVQQCAFRRTYRHAIRFGASSTSDASPEATISNSLFEDIGEDAIYGGALRMWVLHNTMRRLSQNTANGDGLGFISLDPVAVWFMFNDVDHSDVDSKHCVIFDTSTGAGQVFVGFNTFRGYGWARGESGENHTVVNADCQAFIFGNRMWTAGLGINVGGANSVVSGNRLWVSSYRATAPTVSVNADGVTIAHNAVQGPGATVSGKCLTAANTVTTLTARNNIFRQINRAINLDGSGTTLTKSNNWFDDVTSPYLDYQASAIALDAADETGDLTDYLHGDLSLIIPDGTTWDTLSGVNPLAMAGYYMAGARLANGRPRPGYVPIGACAAMLAGPSRTA